MPITTPVRLLAIAFALVGLTAEKSLQAAEPSSKPLRVYVGTYTAGEGEGINLLEMDPKTGALGAPRVVARVPNPSFLAISPSQKFLYSVSEVRDVEANGVKRSGGGVFAFRVDPHDGTLTQLNWQSSGGAGPCHVSLDNTGRNVFVANYMGGSVGCLPVNEDGSLREMTSFFQHVAEPDSSIHNWPRGHSAYVDAGDKYVVVADLGLDQLKVYRFDARQGAMTPHPTPFVRTEDGAGPRHFAFHPDAKHAFNNNELSSSITAYAWDADNGTLTPRQTLSTLPDDFNGKNSTAECLVHPSGKFVYVSNRGHDSIAGFRIDDEGLLTPLGQTSSHGKIPRNFGFTPDGRFMLVANQDSGNIVVFQVDAGTGALTRTEHEAHIPKPVCVRVVAPR